MLRGVADKRRLVGLSPVRHRRQVRRVGLQHEPIQPLRLGRRASGDGARIGNGMLLAVRPDNSPHFMLAHVCWIMAVEGELQMGISMLAGAPRLVDLARTPDGSGEHEARGVLMPEVPRIGQPECVALPSGWYRKSRDILLTADDGTRRVRLVESIERGADFDLARIEPSA
jgi:hypothetical protein